MAKLHTHYDNLMVARNAPIEVIRAAYKSLAHKYHPDRNPGNPEATRIMAILNLSYEVLSDPERRAIHDESISELEAADRSTHPRSDAQEKGPTQARSSQPANFTFKKFRLEGDVIYWKEKSFPVSAIKHLFFKRVLTKQRVNLVKVGEAHSAHLTITMDGAEKINVSIDEATILMGWNRDKSHELKSIADIYLYLAKVTFEKRISLYVKQVADQGYFEYGGCRFYPKKKIVFRDKEFSLKDSSFLRSPGYVELRKKDFGLMDKVKREVSFTKIPQFNTQTDSDVIFTLLDYYFGLRWN